MLKFFFDRSSWVVRLLEAVGVAAVLYDFFHLKAGGFLFLFLVVGYLFIRICAVIRWYPHEARGIGIEVHFFKTLVPASYILAIASAVLFLKIFWISMPILILADLMMLVLISVNGILVYFYLRDKDPLPVNYFSSNKYLGKDTV
jgi:hypothetical protein